MKKHEAYCKKSLIDSLNELEEVLTQRNLPSIETIMSLSKSRYEGASIDTEIVFLEDNVTNDLLVRFKPSSVVFLAEEMQVEESLVANSNFVNRLNKYCHMANSTMKLFASRIDYCGDTYAIIGIGILTDDTKWVAKLKLNGHLSWTLEYKDINKSHDVIKRICYDGVFREQKETTDSIPNEFDTESKDVLEKIINCAKKQKHGTMIVVLEKDEAIKEAERLCQIIDRGICVEPFDLSSCLHDVLIPITSIDGAVLIDNTGWCYGIGVILDGIATEPANSARGSRFNSAYVYVNNKKYEKKKCMCIVISEDKMVDLICTTNLIKYHNESLEIRETFELSWLIKDFEARQCWEGEVMEARENLLHGDVDTIYKS